MKETSTRRLNANWKTDKLEKYAQDILDECERYDIWHTESMKQKATSYISDKLVKAYEYGVRTGIKTYREWILGSFGFDGTELEWVNEDAIRARFEADGCCSICNKYNGKLGEDGICSDCC